MRKNTIRFFLFIVLLQPLFLLLSCQKSYIVLNHSEIHAAYSSDNLRYIPSLKGIVENGNRDLAAHAMFQLGNFYYKLLNGKRYFMSDEEIVKQTIVELETFFVSNANADIDFNLKNHVFRNLIFFGNEVVEEIYLKALNDYVDEENVENVTQVLLLAGKRPKYYSEVNFATLLEICQLGLSKENSWVIRAAIHCLNDLNISMVESNMDVDMRMNNIKQVNQLVDSKKEEAPSFYFEYILSRFNKVTNIY